MHLHQFWDSEPPPAEVAPLIETCRRVNSDMAHRLFSEGHARDYIAGHVGLRHLRAFDQCAVPAMKADYFRYCAVWNQGGFYCDADLCCIGRLGALLPPEASAVMFQRDNGVITNGLFGFKPSRHPLMEMCLEVATRAIERRTHGDDVWLTTGPGVFTTLWLVSQHDEHPRPDADDDDDRARSLRLCREVVADLAGSPERLFSGVRLAPYGALQAVVQEPRLSYKSTARHWKKWKGSIYRPLPHAA